MAITGPASYVSTTQEFLDHWTAVNAYLPEENPLILEGGFNLLGFGQVRGTLMTARDAVEDAAVERALARATLEIKKEWLLTELNSFKTKVIAVAAASPYARVLTLVPGISDGQEVFSRPMVQAAKLWQKLNAAPPGGVTAPVVLKSGVTQELFATAVAQLALLYDEMVNAEQEVTLCLERRNDFQDAIYELMKKYRLGVPSVVPDGNALMDTLPQITPTSSRTPDPVTLAGAWNAASAKADLTAAVSEEADLKEYELRACVGEDYNTDLESVVASVPKGEPPVFHTDKFLTVAGATASFRVYVVLKSGNEAGSNTVTVARP